MQSKCRSGSWLCLLLVILILIALTLPVCAAEKPRENWQWLASGFSISPDGKKIAYPVLAYNEYADPVTDLWVSNLDGSSKKKIGSLEGYWSADWYDGKHVTGSQWNCKFMPVFPVGSGNRRDLRFTDRYQWITPAISPNAKWVAFTAVQNEPVQGGIWLLDTNTGAIKQLSLEAVKSYVSWSPDSKFIAYGVGSYQKHYAMKTTNVITGETTDLKIDGVGAAWSPDGKSIAYTGSIADGGSWMDGIPVDGAIMLTNLQTKATSTLTEPPINIHDKETKRWEILGSFNPQWSPDGKQIAYRRSHTVREGSDVKLKEEQIWVVGADGSGRKKVSDKWGPFKWAPDSKSIFIKRDKGIERIALTTGKVTTAVAWNIPEPPAVSDTPKTLRAVGASVEYSGMKPDYPKALLTVVSEARRLYAEKYHFNMPDSVNLSITKDPNRGTQLWTDGETQINLVVSSMDKLAPPMQSRVFNIYGICHELGHVAMYHNIDLLGLTAGVGQGWAHYAGSVVVDDVYKKYGKDLWPQPYNYSETEGLVRLEKQLADSKGSEDPTNKVALAFYAAHKKYGVDKVMAAMVAVEAGRPYAKDIMARFADALVKETSDESARALIPADLLAPPKVEWKTADREINDKTVEGVTQVKDNTGVLLKYDDGSSQDMQSIGGAGEAVVFMTPPGSWAADYIEIYASRYGTEQPPKEDFDIFLCDQDFGVIKDIKKPYSTFERGDPKWYKLDFDPVKVTPGFYVCVNFNATGNKGVYVYYDKDVKKNHSRVAMPYASVSDSSKYDWMIRVHLVPAQ